jgi:nicotinamide riboside kinase
MPSAHPIGHIRNCANGEVHIKDRWGKWVSPARYEAQEQLGRQLLKTEKAYYVRGKLKVVPRHYKVVSKCKFCHCEFLTRTRTSKKLSETCEKCYDNGLASFPFDVMILAEWIRRRDGGESYAQLEREYYPPSSKRRKRSCGQLVSLHVRNKRHLLEDEYYAKVAERLEISKQNMEQTVS